MTGKERSGNRVTGCMQAISEAFDLECGGGETVE